MKFPARSLIVLPGLTSSALVRAGSVSPGRVACSTQDGINETSLRLEIPLTGQPAPAPVPAS